MIDYTIVLSSRDQVLQGAISNVDQGSINVIRNMNSANEISFDVYYEMDGLIEPRWEQLKVLRLIYVVELNEYFQIDISYKDSLNQVMSITGSSLCESELSQINLYNIEINSEADIKRTDYQVTKFYNPTNKDASLLNRILDKAPHYSVGHVDSSLMNLQRTFSINGTTIYDFMTGECSTQFNCLFLFDSTTRTINAYDLYTVCEDCGERGDYIGECPKCGSHNLKYYGEDTLIYVDKENLTEEVSLTTETNKIKNSLKLSAGDDDITAVIRGLNPNGSDYIYYFNDDTLEDMPENLVEKLNDYNDEYSYYQNEYQVSLNNVTQYNALVSKYNQIITEQGSYCGTVDYIPATIVGYPKLTESLYGAIDFRLILNSSLMPGRSIEGVSAESEAQKIYDAYKDDSDRGKLSPVAQSSVTDQSSYSTAEAAIKNYSKIFIKSGYVKIDLHTINGEDYNASPAFLDEEGNKFKFWEGYYKITNYSDEEDIAFVCETGVIVPTDKTSPSAVENARVQAQNNPMTIIIYDNYQEFMTQRVAKKIASEDSDDGSIYDMVEYNVMNDDGTISQTKLNAFKKALTYYSLSRLTSFYDVCMAAMDVLVDSLPTLQNMYNSFYQKSIVCVNAVDSINNDISVVDGVYNEIVSVQNRIKTQLNLKNYLTDDLYKIFCMYRRDGEYNNSNYTSTGLTTPALFKRAQEFMEVANEEMVKAGTPQYSISATLFNLLKIKEFASIKDKFVLGNWIRIRAGEKVYRLRLISYTEKNDDDTTLTVEFSNVTIAEGIVNDIQSILSNAKSMASSYGYVQNQASASSSKADKILAELDGDLTSSQAVIKNNINEEIVIDDLGITGRSFNDEINNYEPNQIRITHNLICFTSDNWKSVKMAVGLHNATVYEYNQHKDDVESLLVTDYGLSAQFVNAGYVTGSHVYGSELIGGDIYSDNYSGTKKTGTHIDLNDGTFTFAGGKFSWDGSNLVIDGSVIKESTLEVEGLSLEKDENNKFEFSKSTGLLITGGVINLGASDGKSYLHLANGEVDIFGYKNGSSVLIGSLKASDSTETDNAKTGVKIETNANTSYVSIGDAYTLNLGENPNGMTYDHIFRGDIFTNTSLYATDLYQERIGKAVLNDMSQDFWISWNSETNKLELTVDGEYVGSFVPEAENTLEESTNG